MMDRHAMVEVLREHWLTEGPLPWLERLDDETLADLHDEVLRHASRLDRAQAGVYSVMANTTKFLPKFVVAKMAHSLDPYVIAQITRHLDAKTAATISKSLEPSFLGEVTLHLDVEKINEIVRYTDIDRVTLVVERMGDRGMHHRLGELADAMEPQLLNRLTNKLGDPERVAAIALEMRNEQNLLEVARSLKPKLLERIIRVLQDRGSEKATMFLAHRQG